MSNVLQILLAAALLLFVVLSLFTWHTIRRLRFVAPRATPLQAQDVPAEVRELLAPGLDELLALGFKRPRALLQTGMVAGGKPLPQHALVLLHADVPAAAYVHQLTQPERTRQWGIFFVSQTRSGTTLITRNRSSILGPLPVEGTVTHDCWLPTWAALWQAHRQRMRQLSPGPWQAYSVDEWIVAGSASDATGFDNRVRQRELVPVGDGSFRFGFVHSLVLLARAWAAFNKTRKPMQGDVPAAGASPAGCAPADPALALEQGGGPMAMKVSTYEADAAARRGSSWSSGAKWALFFITAALAAASFGMTLGLGTLPALLAVLLFHELGHYAAMRWAGYQDLKVFFLPFLGAAVSGRHEQPSAWQELAVLFAGPVPGLLLGLAGMAWLPPEAGSPLPLAGFWHDCAVLAVTLNAFNLLPIHPLDGGKIFEILLLSRWPWLAFAGRVLGVLALGAYAAAMESGVGRSVLLGLVLLMLIGLAHTWREVRVATALKRDKLLGGQTRSSALQAVFAAIHRLGYHARPWPDQRLMADSLLPVVTRPPMRAVARVGGLAVYGFFLVLPLLALVILVWRGQQAADTSLVRAEAAAAALQAAAPAAAQASGAASAAGGELRMIAGAEAIDNELRALQARVAAAPTPAQGWSLLEEEFAGGLLGSVQAYGLDKLPAAAALLGSAQTLAPQLPDALAKRASVALWRAEAERDSPARLAQLQAALDLYDTPEGATADPTPLLRATSAWLDEAPEGDLPARLARIDKSLQLAGTRGTRGDAATLQAALVNHTLAQGERNAALTLARSYYEQAQRAADLPLLVQQADLLAQTTLAVEGAAAGLAVVDQALVQMQVKAQTQAQSPSKAGQPDAPLAGHNPYADGLRRQGLWMAEAAGRSDWQRAQVDKLISPSGVEQLLPWWLRALTWATRLGRPSDVTLFDVERAHWQGDEALAQQQATALMKRRPGFAVRLVESAGPQSALAAAQQKLLHPVRRALYARYGIPVVVVPARAGS